VAPGTRCFRIWTAVFHEDVSIFAQYFPEQHGEAAAKVDCASRSETPRPAASAVICARSSGEILHHVPERIDGWNRERQLWPGSAPALLSNGSSSAPASLRTSIPLLHELEHRGVRGVSTPSPVRSSGDSGDAGQAWRARRGERRVGRCMADPQGCFTQGARPGSSQPGRLGPRRGAVTPGAQIGQCPPTRGSISAMPTEAPAGSRPQALLSRSPAASELEAGGFLGDSPSG
jgi:hypothetical protein